jgi:hypothetical protein
MAFLLNAVEARVLGALMEKEATTPEYYPLSLNALLNACNQKNNREPVMALEEDAVRLALHGLEDDGLAAVARGTESRVTKYEHRVQEVFNFTRGEAAVVCVLLLRGPQTPGELRGRTERMHRFEELEDVLGTLEKLMRREPPLAAALARQPGTKEIRYAHLLSGDGEMVQSQVSQERGDVDRGESAGHRAHGAQAGVVEERVAALEADVAHLRGDVAQLREEMERLQGR